MEVPFNAGKIEALPVLLLLQSAPMLMLLCTSWVSQRLHF
jgi:hypothetical protein